MTVEEFKKIAETIPNAPGIYKYFDQQKNLLYVGKAKNLRKRVRSYFYKTAASTKTIELVKKIDHIDFVVVNTEQDAFLLENSLIKEYKPKYNIEFKDDKSYPYVVIKNEDFPRVFLTRNAIKDKSEYIGPFASVNQVRALLYFIRENIPLRTCKHRLSSENIKKRKFSVCLEYHLGNCKAPCVGKQSQADYDNDIAQVKKILKGQIGEVIAHYKVQMQTYAAALAFEKANAIKQQLEKLEHYQAKSIVVNANLSNVDVVGFKRYNDKALVNYFVVQSGAIIHTYAASLNIVLEEADEDILCFAIQSFREKIKNLSNEIIVPFPIHYPDPNVKITVPKMGDKKKLLDLSIKNILYALEDIKRKEMHSLKAIDETADLLRLAQLQQALHLSELPRHIECFDNSNFQGSHPVAAMVCFKNGQPDKQSYRKFNIKTVVGINDFDSMKEIVFRRYKRLKAEEKPLPQLVIIDGGKGQLNAALESIKTLGLEGKMTIIGLAKNQEEIFFPYDKASVLLDWQSPELQLVRFIRDEVHRFGISFHRDKRSKAAFKNQLEDIEGVGEKTIELLLKKFKSLKNIQAQSEAVIAKLIGQSRAKKIFSFFEKEQ